MEGWRQGRTGLRTVCVEPHNTLVEPHIIDFMAVLLHNAHLTALIAYLELEDANVLKALLVLEFAFVHRHLKDFYLLEEKRHFIVATYKLRSDHVFLFHRLQ